MALIGGELLTAQSFLEVKKMAQYKTGSVNVTNGSQSITGVGTLWNGQIAAGDIFTVSGDNTWYEVGSVNSNTSITLTSNYTGTTATGAVYAITRDFTTNKSIPYPQKGDIETASLLKRAMNIIDEELSLGFDSSNVTITGGTINGTTIGATTRAAGNFTTLNANGNTTLGDASTDIVTVNGYMGVGGSPVASIGMYLRSDALTSSSQDGVRSAITGTSSATGAILGFRSLPQTAASAFTCATVSGFYADNATKGAGSTITNQHGVYIADQTQGTNNYGITSAVSSGTNKWNIYASGTAANYFAGNVGIGNTTVTGVFGSTLRVGTSTGGTVQVPAGRMYTPSGGTDLYISGGIASDGSIIFNGGATTKEYVKFSTTEAVFNDPGNDYDFRVESDTNTHAIFLDAGNSRVGINNSSPTVALDITGDLKTSGNTTLGDASTDTVTVNGYMGVGGAASTDVGVQVTSSALSGTSQFGVNARPTFTSGATSASAAIRAEGRTAAAAFTASDVNGVRVVDATKGAGSTITNQHGLYVADQTQGTNNYGITSLVSSGTNKWNIYASGTAANYFAGNVGIGTSSPSYLLDVNKNTTSLARFYYADGTYNPRLAITGSSSGISFNLDYSTSASDIIFSINSVEKFRLKTTEAVFNDPGNDYDFRVESDTNTHALFVQGSDGNVGIGTTTPTSALHVLVPSTASAPNTAFVVTDGTTSTFSVKLSNNVTSIVTGGGGETFTIENNGSERLRITSAGNVSIGGTANRATTVGSAALNIFNGTAPVGTLTNGISIYSSAGEAYVMDAAGNATLFSPHDAETNEWIFKSKHTPTGKVLRIDVEKLLRFVNDHFGLDAVQEFIEP